MFVRSIRLMTYSKKRNGRSRNDTLRKTAASLGSGSAAAVSFTLSDIRRLQDYIVERAHEAGTPVIANASVEEASSAVIELVLGANAERLEPV